MGQEGDSALFSDAGDAHHAGRRARMARQNGPQARLRGTGRTGRAARRGPLRGLHFARGDPDALLRQYRSLGRCRHDGRYVGDGRLLRPGRRARPPERRRGRGRCAGTRAGGSRHHRGRLFHRLRAIVVEGAHICRESVLGAGVVITGSTHIIDVTEAEPKQYKGIRPRRIGGHPGQLSQAFPRRRVRRPLCADYRAPQGVHRQEKTSLTAALRDFGVSV